MRVQVLDDLLVDRALSRRTARTAFRGFEGLLGGTAVLERVATALDSSGIDLTATNDVLWDEVVAIEPDGVEEVPVAASG